ncbi:MAG: BamA/TamA family outer membrane protein [Myxococcales bacterium]|nr:BamA/TamA family outer membrane protein [Myxococcales bacterium]
MEIAGVPADAGLSVAEIRELIPQRDGETFDYEAFELAKPRIVEAMRRAGYAFAKLEASVAADVVLDHAIIRLELTPGLLCRFGDVVLRGFGGKLGRAARARVPIQTGERYSSAKLAEAQVNLYDMNRFSQIRIEPDLSVEREEIPIVITVTRATRRELRLGGGFGVDPTSYEIRGRSTYNITGSPWTLTNTRLEFRPALVRLRDSGQIEPRIEAIAGLDRIDLFRPLIKGEMETAFTYRTVEAYTSVGPRLRLALRAPLLRRLVHGELGWQLEILKFRDISPAIDEALQTVLGLDVLNRVGAYFQALVVDLRDSPVAPTRGGYAEIRIEEGTAAAGGAFDYVRIVPDVRGYVPMGAMVLAARLRVGAFFGDIPVASRFFGGGASGQRGFPERRLSPSASNTVDGEAVSVIYGGGALFEVGGEVRSPLGSIRGLDLGGVLFLDGADVTERIGAIDIGNLHWAIGAGLRVPTIIGAIRLDVGYRLNRVGIGEPYPGHRFAFHLNIGEAF